MEEFYERIKRMTKEEMQDFIYWVYMNGNNDGKENYCDTYGPQSYFGGYILTKNADEVMQNIKEFYSQE